MIFPSMHGTRIAWITICLGMFLMLGCGSSSAPSDTSNNGTDTPVDLTWSQDMATDALLEILSKMGISMAPDASREDVISTIEQATGCGCFGATCGTGYCGHECGACEGAGEACFSGSCETATTCPNVGFNLEEQTSLLKNNLETYQFRYEAKIPNSMFEIVKITSNTPIEQALGPGTYDLRRFDIAACELCVRAYRGCESGICTETYVGTAGEVKLDAGVEGDSFSGSLANIKFQQAYEDPKTGNVYLFPQPQGTVASFSRCIETASFTSATESVVVEPTDCDPEGNGVTIGSSIGDFELKNCLGETVRFHSGCGQKAVWVVAVAGW